MNRENVGQSRKWRGRETLARRTVFPGGKIRTFCYNPQSLLIIFYYDKAGRDSWSKDGSVCDISGIRCKDLDIPAANRGFCSFSVRLDGRRFGRIFAFAVSDQLFAFSFSFGEFH
jgi:hypothetical protein